MTVLEEFKKAVHESAITKTEIAWSMNMSYSAFEELINGLQIISESQELFMFRFIWKQNRKNKTA